MRADNLAPDGVRVAGASGAGEGLRAIEVRQPRLVVLDLALDEGSGLGLLNRVRAADGLASRIDPDLPVIVLTGPAGEADRVRSFARGADDHVCKPRLWHVEAFCSAHPDSWSAFLAALPGEPARVVCDAHKGMLQAIEECWPGTEPHQCESHLQHALDRLLAKEARKRPSEELAELRDRAEGALAGPSFWRPFVRAARALENESLDRWIAVNGPMIEGQFARRLPPARRPPEMPLTTSALEQLTRPIYAALCPRRYALKNRERLNPLLMRMQLHVNGDDDVQAYAKAIRKRLEANTGRPQGRRRGIADPKGSASLR